MDSGGPRSWLGRRGGEQWGPSGQVWSLEAELGLLSILGREESGGPGCHPAHGPTAALLAGSLRFSGDAWTLSGSGSWRAMNWGVESRRQLNGSALLSPLIQGGTKKSSKESGNLKLRSHPNLGGEERRGRGPQKAGGRRGRWELGSGKGRTLLAGHCGVCVKFEAGGRQSRQEPGRRWPGY